VGLRDTFLFAENNFLFISCSMWRFCYNYFFGGKYSSISQEYPQINLRVRDTIYVAYKQAKEKYK